MGLASIRELIREHALDQKTLLPQFLDLQSGEVLNRRECEYWDYKRDLPNIEEANQLAELAADILSFHNTRGGYLIFGITNDFVVLGVHETAARELDSNKINSKLRKYVGETFHCDYSAFTVSIGGARKTISFILVPARLGVAVRVQRNAPGNKPFFKEGEIFIRSGDIRKRPETETEFSFVFNALTPEIVVGTTQLRPRIVRPGFRLFYGDCTKFIGEQTRKPLVNRVIEELLLGKWDIVLLRGVGGVGKTAMGIEITTRLASSDEFAGHFGGIISLSAKEEQLNPFNRVPIRREFLSYEDFLRQIIRNTGWSGNVPALQDLGHPDQLNKFETFVRDWLKSHNVLLFIDNYENVEVREPRISDFLASLPTGVRTLLTSRHQPLRVPAYPIEVPPLSKEEAETLALTEASEQRVDIEATRYYMKDILRVSSRIPLAIKWIISCTRNTDHLKELIEQYSKDNPREENLCQFCFGFEYGLLPDIARQILVLMTTFRSAPTARQLAIAADVDVATVNATLDQLENYSLVIRDQVSTKDAEVFRLLELTHYFAASKLRDFDELEKKAKNRLRAYYGASIAALMSAAHEMIAGGSTAAARKFIDEEILEREPTNPQALLLRGRTLQEEFQYPAAIRDFAAALGHTKGDGRIAKEVAMRLVVIADRDPELCSDSFLDLLVQGYSICEDDRIGVEIARRYARRGKSELALEYYESVARRDVPSDRESWEEATLFVCRYLREHRNASVALDCCRNGLRKAPHSRVLANCEKSLLEELGTIRYKGS